MGAVGAKPFRSQTIYMFNSASQLPKIKGLLPGTLNNCYFPLLPE